MKVTLGYEGKVRSYTTTRRHVGTAHAVRRLWWARSPHHHLRLHRSLFVLLGTCLERIVGAIFATKVSFSTNPFGRKIAEISFASRTCKHRAFTSVIQIECLLLLSARR